VSLHFLVIVGLQEGINLTRRAGCYPGILLIFPFENHGILSGVVNPLQQRIGPGSYDGEGVPSLRQCLH